MLLKNNSKIPLDKFINKVLYDKTNGYYMNKNPIGYKGDFVTAPNISIMFSEMISIWIISFWEKMGCPNKINIIELGAGNGEMMFQILKTIENFKKFKTSANFIIYEKSPYLKKIQKKKLEFKNIKWINDLKKISNYPSIFVANEFFDALPVKQFINKGNEWFEKYIVNKDKCLQFYEQKTKTELIEKLIKEKIPKNHKFIEYSPLANKKLNIISNIIKKQNGGLLVIDYGYDNKKMYDTLQSIKKHKKNFLLENVYQADITHLINFNFFKKKIINFKLDSVKLTTQREFLLKMGILKRAEIISKNKSLSKKSNIYYRLKRLIDPKQMGTLFKVLFATNKKNNFNLGF
tara:strand:- start:4875 stop:5918 length:1044 start_codon:yes stop_codon:yes gene_type:complete